MVSFPLFHLNIKFQLSISEFFEESEANYLNIYQYNDVTFKIIKEINISINTELPNVD